MPHFGTASRRRLDTCHADLQRIFEEVVKDWDCAILCGHRDEVAQMLAYESGKSQLAWPDSKHNRMPSMAVDVAPYPLDWNDRGAFYMLAGYVFRVAHELRKAGVITHRIRYGGDWNGDHHTKDQRFMDLPHYELI